MVWVGWLVRAFMADPGVHVSREAQMRREEQEREQMHSQLEAEDKMRLGVEEYKNKLTSEMETVGRQLVSERKKNQALELYRCAHAAKNHCHAPAIRSTLQRAAIPSRHPSGGALPTQKRSTPNRPCPAKRFVFRTGRLCQEVYRGLPKKQNLTPSPWKLFCRDKLHKEVEAYKADSTAHHKSMLELETQRKQLGDDMEEIRMRYGGDLEDVSERLEVDMRTSAGLEGYRRNLGEELDSVRKKIGSTSVR